MRYFATFGKWVQPGHLKYALAGTNDRNTDTPLRLEELPIVPYRTTRVWVYPHETQEFLRHVLLEQDGDITTANHHPPVGECVYEGNPREAYALFLTYAQLMKGAPA